MARLIMVSEAAPEVSGSDEEQGSDEHRPLLRNEETGCSSSSGLQGGAEVTANYSLIPDASLPAQVRRHDAIFIRNNLSSLVEINVSYGF